MIKQTLRFKPALVLILGLSVLCSGVFAQAEGNRYHYRDGHWYGQGEVVVSSIGVGSVVESLPPEHTTIVVEKTPYYYDNTRYYSESPDGTYVVVTAPRR